MSALTKEGFHVKVGQVWKDLDPRVQRTVTVVEVHPDARPHPFALVTSSNGARSKIRISRMHQHSQGFRLVSEAEA